MSALQFRQNGDRLEAYQVDGEAAGYIAPEPGGYWASKLRDSIFYNEHATSTEARDALVDKYARRFGHRT
jgi:hypothetical protein